MRKREAPGFVESNRKHSKRPESPVKSSTIATISKWALLAVCLALAGCKGGDKPVDNQKKTEQLPTKRLTEHLTRMGLDNANDTLNLRGFIEGAKEGQKFIVGIDVQVTLDDGTVVDVKKEITTTGVVKAGGSRYHISIPVIKATNVKRIAGTIGLDQRIDFSF